MKAQLRMPQGEDVYRANLRLHCCLAPAKRKAILARLSEHGHQQGHGPSIGLTLLVLAQIAAALARTNYP